MKENYFDYGSHIESKRISEAIAMPAGVGPVCGFGSATISGSQLTVYPYGRGDAGSANANESPADPLRFIMRSRVDARYIPTAQDAAPGSATITFGVIARDGILYRSGEPSMKVTIENSKSTFNQVFLFASHKHITEPVQNLVEFRAFYNESTDNDFFALYQKTKDIYYPASLTSRRASVADKNDPVLIEDFNYEALLKKVKASCSTYRAMEKELVLVGIYGDGTSATSEALENFAIVPYNGTFPGELPYNLAIHSYFKQALSRVEAFMDYTAVEGTINPETGLPFTSLPEYMLYLINQKTSGLQAQVEKAMIPVGSIILWEGEEMPDDTWEEYTSAAGRVVIGYRQGGITRDVDNSGGSTALTILQHVGDTYDPVPAEGTWSIHLAADRIPQHRHSVGHKRGSYDGEDDVRDNPVTSNFTDRDQSIDSNIYGNQMFGVTMVSGAVFTSNNLVGGNVTDEQNKATTYIDKLIPAITLRYIRKKSSTATSSDEG